MATIIINDVLDHLIAAMEDEREIAKPNRRWTKAITTAYDWLIEQEQVEYDVARSDLLVPSATVDGRWYYASSDGACQCEAFTLHGVVCWHRGSAVLITKALARQQRCEERDRAQRERESKAERRAAAYAGVAELFNY